jgi:5'-3' exonuclease
VDISIYLYKFLGDGYFMEQVYLFLSIFKYYCIQPIFVFDGKPPVEKNALLKRRYCEKQEAQTEYHLLEKQVADISDPVLLSEVQHKMNSLKKKMVRLTYYHIDQVIELIRAFGFEYYMAPHEADQLCVHLTVSGKTYACLSNDMDIIVSGCPFVVRNLNLMTHEVYLYDTKSILSDLQLSFDEFREIIVLSGTDYELSMPVPAESESISSVPVSIKTPNISIKKAFEYYKQYKSIENVEVRFIEILREDVDICENTFYDWLHNKGIIQKQTMQKICDMFDISNYTNEMNDFVEKNTPVEKPKMNVSTIKTIMQKYHFIFD